MKEWKPTLLFDEITLGFIQQFHNHELEVDDILSTAYKKHSNLKFLIGVAVNKEKLVRNPYEKLEVKRNIKVQSSNVLTEEEFKRLQVVCDKKEYSRGKQEVLREFLFSYYTSLSFTEFFVLTYLDIKSTTIDSDETYLILCDERTKTSVAYRIPVVSPAVVASLGNSEPCRKVFPLIFNQSINRYLKDIVSDLKIGKTMIFHRAWHSFRAVVAKKGIYDGIAERIMGYAEGDNIKDIYTYLHDEDTAKEM